MSLIRPAVDSRRAMVVVAVIGAIIAVPVGIVSGIDWLELASIAALSTAELSGEHGIERLSREMLRRVNDYLATAGVAPLRAVAVQDFW